MTAQNSERIITPDGEKLGQKNARGQKRVFTADWAVTGKKDLGRKELRTRATRALGFTRSQWVAFQNEAPVWKSYLHEKGNDPK